MSTTRHHDVIVVGARCAGAATARLLARRGHDVLLVDRAALPSDTLSTHGIARGGVVQLARWGLLETVLDSGAPPIREVTFVATGATATHRIKDRAGVDHLLAPRRHVLDGILLDAALDAGVRMRARTTATGLLRDDGGRVAGIGVRGADGTASWLTARHVVGADGLRSTMARRFGARTIHSFTSDAALFYAYVDEVPWGGFEFHTGEQGYAGAFPTHDGAACVWVTRPLHRLEDLRAAGAQRAGAFVATLEEVAPALASTVRAGRLASPVRGAATLPNHVRQAWGDGWSLVGDAGYHRDPITGHGITDAFRDAELLADALHAALVGDATEDAALAAYAEARDDALLDTYRITRELTRFPDPQRFAELQIQLSDALEREAAHLASRPAPAGIPAAHAA